MHTKPAMSNLDIRCVLMVNEIKIAMKQLMYTNINVLPVNGCSAGRVMYRYDVFVYWRAILGYNRAGLLF